MFQSYERTWRSSNKFQTMGLIHVSEPGQCPNFRGCVPLETLWGASLQWLPNGIPKIIHQTWKTRVVPEHWAQSQGSWKTHHTSWLYLLWTDDDIRNYIQVARPSAWALFEKLEWPIQRVDLFRYFVLYDFGGLYVDLDILCKGPIDDALGTSNGDIFLVHSANTPSHYTNALMASSLRPSAKRFWSSVVAHVESWPTKLSEKLLGHALRHLQIMMSTGPMALTKVANETLEAITVLPQKRWNPFDLSVAGDLEEQVSQDALVQILSGSSWHDVDSQAISMLHIYKWPLVAMAVLLGLYTIINARLMYRKALALIRNLRASQSLKKK